MVADLHAARAQAKSRISALQAGAPSASMDGRQEGTPGLERVTSAESGDREGDLPTLRFRDGPRDASDGWVVFDKPILYLYAGKGPFVSRDLMQWPVSHADDGCIDVVVEEVVRSSLIDHERLACL